MAEKKKIVIGSFWLIVVILIIGWICYKNTNTKIIIETKPTVSDNKEIIKIGYPVIDSSFATSTITWKKYMDKEDGVSFEYPSEWKAYSAVSLARILPPNGELITAYEGNLDNTVDIDFNYKDYTLSPIETEYVKKNVPFKTIKTHTDYDTLVAYYYTQSKMIQMDLIIECPNNYKICSYPNYKIRMTYIFEHILDSMEYSGS